VGLDVHARSVVACGLDGEIRGAARASALSWPRKSVPGVDPFTARACGSRLRGGSSGDRV